MTIAAFKLKLRAMSNLVLSLSHKEKVSIGAYSVGGYYGENLTIEVFFSGNYSSKNHFVVNIADTKKILKDYCKKINKKCLNEESSRSLVTTEKTGSIIFNDLSSLYNEEKLTKGLLSRVSVFFESKSQTIELTNSKT